MSTHSQERLEQAAARGAQAQAQLEEEIAQRLPREVLNINRRLVQQQASVDALQGQLSRLKEMVAQIGVALGNLPAPSTAPNSPAPASKPVTATQSPPSASSEFYGAHSLRSYLCGRPKLQQHKEGGSGGDLTMGTNTSGKSIFDEQLVHKQPGPAILSMANDSSHSFVTHQAQTRSSFNSAQFTSPASTASMLSNVGTAARSSASPLSSPLGASFVVPAAMIASTAAKSASVLPAAPAYVAHQVFDKIPTPSSWHAIQTTSPSYCYGHQTPTQSSCVQGGSNFSEPNLDGMPQSYGFDNLKRGSVFLADSSEHSFYALPEDYPLERSTRDPVFDAYEDETDCSSTEFVDVIAGISVQQAYEENQHESEQLAKCFGRESENASSELVQVLKPLFEPELNIGCSLNLNNGNYTIEFLVAASSLPQEWEPGIETPSSICLCLQGLTARIETENHLSWLPVPELAKWQSQLQRSNTFSVWDPGIWSIMDMKFGKTAVHLVHSGKTPCKLLIFIGQPIGQNHFWAQLLLCLSWCHTPNVFLQVQYHCLPFVMDCPYSEPVQQLVCYPGMFTSTEAIMSAICMSTTITVRLSCTHIPDLTVWRNQLVGSAASYLRDPGIDRLEMSKLIDQLEFIHQQSINENLKTKCLMLSSKEYLQIWDNGTFFTTFLPP